MSLARKKTHTHRHAHTHTHSRPRQTQNVNGRYAKMHLYLEYVPVILWSIHSYSYSSDPKLIAMSVYVCLYVFIFLFFSFFLICSHCSISILMYRHYWIVHINHFSSISPIIAISLHLSVLCSGRTRCALCRLYFSLSLLQNQAKEEIFYFATHE